MDVDFLTDDPLDDIKYFDEDELQRKKEQVPSFLRWLPYHCHTQAEFDCLLNEAVQHVCACVQSEQFGATLLEWCQYIQYLLTLKYPIERTYRARMARLFYDLAVMPKLDSVLTDMAATICIQLVRPKRKISIQDLELPWRPLYDVLDREVHHKQRKIGSSAMAGVLLDLAECCQRFFPASEAPAMLETILPNLDGRDLNSVVSTQALLVHFLPLSNPDAWLPTLFRLWETFRSSLFDDQMLDVLARLAELHVTEPQSSTRWSETGLFTDEQFALIMSKCLRSAGLPVGSSKAANSVLMAQSSSVRTGADATASQKTLRMKKPSDRLHSFALIIVYSMAHDSDDPAVVAGSKALSHLAQFVQATETYFHPSNWGPWQAQLASLVQHLTWEFARRVKAEQDDEACHTPEAWRLTPMIQREFVIILRTVCLLSLFSKDPMTSLSTQSSLKRMAFLQPELILPAILQRAYTSLDTLETTQRTGAVIAALGSTSQPLLSRSLYPPGAKHIAPLLRLCLPGIDMNDTMKTMNTCVFILSASVSLIVSDASMTEDDEPLREDKVQVDEESISTSAAEDYAARLSTADLDAWSSEFVQRVLALFSALPDEGKGGKIGEKNEEAVLNMIIATCDAFCSALGEEAFTRCFDIVMEYVRTTTAANGVKVIGSLVGCFARANSAAVLERVVPLCCERIRHELEHGASSVPTTSTSVPRAQDAALHWHLNVLSSAVMFAGSALLPYRHELLSIMAVLIHACRTERAYVLHAKFVQRVLNALVNTYPAEQRCVNADEWDAPQRRAHPHRMFGALYTQAEVQITWHVPNDDELNMAIEVLSTVLTPVLDKLDTLLGAQVHDDAWHNDVCRFLHVVRYAYAGQLGMARDEKRYEAGAMDVHGDVGDVDAATSVRPLDVSCGAPLHRGDPRYAHVMAFRERVGALLERAAAVVSSLSADHVDAMKQVVRGIRTFLVPHTANTEEVQGLAKLVAFFRTIGRRFAKQQRFPRILWIRRAMLYHVTRQRLQYVFLARTPRDNALVTHLVQLCASDYVAVRRIAQATLENVFAMYRGTRWYCMPQLLNYVAQDASDEQVKGALYVFAAKGFQRAVARNARFTHPVLMALFRLQGRVRPSIQKLVRGVLNDVVARLVDPAMHRAYFRHAALEQVAKELGGAPIDSLTTNAQAWKSVVTSETDALRSELVSLLTSSTTHWAFAQLAVRALRAVLCRDEPVPPSTAELIARLAISDDPDLRVYAQAALVHVLYLAKLQSYSSGADLYLELTHQPLKHTEPTQFATDPAGRARMFFEALTRESHLHDAPTEGWLVWPVHDSYYSVGPPPVPLQPCSQATVDGVARVVAAPAWWEAFARHMSLEMERDYMSADATTLVKSLAQMLGAPLMAHVQSVIEALVAERDRHKHRAAAEITGGIVRGAKHWSLAEHDALHTWLETWLRRAVCECTLDSQPAWQMWVEYVFQQRDPRRLRALVSFVWQHAKEALDDAAQLRGPGQQAHAMQLLASSVHALQSKVHAWDGEAAEARLADVLLAHFAHDYQEVRKAACETLIEWEWACARPMFANVQALVLHSKSAPGSLLAHSEAMRARCALLQQHLRTLRTQRQPSAHGTSAYDRAASTSALWVCLSLDDHRLGPMSTYVLSLVPDLFDAYQLRDNAELSATAHDVLVQVVSYPLSMAQVPLLLDALLHIVQNSTSWHSRLDALPLLQIVYFENLYLLAPAMKQRILDALRTLLHDPHIAVRDMAATSLAGIVRCSQREHITHLSHTFAQMAAKPIPPRGSPGYEVAVTDVHAGVLGATALVAAFPYDVPPWMPTLVLDTIAPHSESPVPISTTVRRCAADFRRTHQDTWAEDQAKFGDRIQEVHDFVVGRSDYFV